MIPFVYMTPSSHIKVGEWGERVAAEYLIRNNFTVVDRNYSQPLGEIDVIAQKAQCVHFVEVKTVSHPSKEAVLEAHTEVAWQPEDLVHEHKQRKLQQIIRTWCSDKDYTGDIQLDVAAVRVALDEKYALVTYYPNIVTV